MVCQTGSKSLNITNTFFLVNVIHVVTYWLKIFTDIWKNNILTPRPLHKLVFTKRRHGLWPFVATSSFIICSLRDSPSEIRHIQCV